MAFVSEVEPLLLLETGVSGLIFLSGGRMGEVGDDEKEEEVTSLLEFELVV